MGVTEVVIDSETDQGTVRLAKAEILVTIAVQAATLYYVLSTFDDGTTWPTVIWHLKRWRHRLHGAFVVRVPAWPVVLEAERIVRGARIG